MVPIGPVLPLVGFKPLGLPLCPARLEEGDDRCTYHRETKHLDSSLFSISEYSSVPHITGEQVSENYRKRGSRMKISLLSCGLLAVFWGAILGGAYYDVQDDETVLVDNKCQCVKVTSTFVPSKDNPGEEVLQRNIRIIVPLKSRENISDPSSPVRTKFVYKLSKLCDKCDTEGAKVGDHGIVPGKRAPCNDPEESCYTYDRNKCYTASCLFSHGGKTVPIETALTPESCYPD